MTSSFLQWNNIHILECISFITSNFINNHYYISLIIIIMILVSIIQWWSYYAHTHSYANTNIQTQAYTHVCKYIYTYKHTNMQAFVHTHTQLKQVNRILPQISPSCLTILLSHYYGIHLTLIVVVLLNLWSIYLV